MHKETVDVYEERGAQWAAARQPVRRSDALAFSSRVPAGSPRVDLGCGAGRYLADLGSPVIGIDAARAMLEQCRQAAPGASLVEGDLELLPFGAGVLGGGWANMSYLHVPRGRLPLALAELQRVLRVGSPIDLQVLLGDYEGSALPQDDVGGRFFASWQPEALLDVLEGAGFSVSAWEVDDYVIRVQATRLLTLADTVAPDMRLLFVGLNPSVYSARAGVGFARPGNRFWPCALNAGAVDKDRDAFDALRTHGVGMTDLVKRPTIGAAELSADEYRSGMARIERLARWLRPAVVCFVGLAGWRAVTDRHAVAGLQPGTVGGRPAYVMPSTSGANAHARPAELVEHIEAALAVGANAD
jgi:TDG/mug DNA glycosylase family protein